MMISKRYLDENETQDALYQLGGNWLTRKFLNCIIIQAYNIGMAHSRYILKVELYDREQRIIDLQRQETRRRHR